MPDFHRKMQDKLRTPEEGADTMIWLAIAKDALNKPSGMFFQGKIFWNLKFLWFEKRYGTC